MAIKGKKKSQSRGSQARRRPAAMPRPVVAARKPKWYQTTAGLSIASIGTIILLLLGAWIFSSVRANDREEQATKDALESYTGAVKSVLQVITPAATDMAGIATADPKTVAEDAANWVTIFQQGQEQLGAAAPPVEADTAHQLFMQSMAAYTTAAQTLQLAGDLPEEDANKLITTTMGQITNAGALWGAAVNELDQERAAVGIGSSGLRSPASGTPSNVPTPLPTIPIDSGDSGGGDGGGNNSGGGNSGDSGGGGNG